MPDSPVPAPAPYRLTQTSSAGGCAAKIGPGDLRTIRGGIAGLRGLDGQDVTLSAKDIKAVTPMGRSLMPEGLLEGLTEQQLRDFFAYLRISHPITK